MLQGEDHIIMANLAKVVSVLVAVMFAIILLANVAA